MSSKFTDVNKGCSCHELLSYKSMSKVVDLGFLDAGKLEVAIYRAPNISNQEGIAGFGDENLLASTFWSFGQVAFKRGLAGRIKRYFSLSV